MLHTHVIRLIVFMISIYSVCGEFKLTVLHTNDVHARVEQSSSTGARCSNTSAYENKCYGGIARRKTIVEQLKSQNPNVLLLDGGDQFQGTTWFNVYDGDEAAYFMNKIPYDVMTIGNHEFDRGPATLGHFLYNTSFPVVSSNTDASREPLLDGQFKKSVILQRGGTQIGIIGYTFQDTKYISSPGPNVEFTDEIEGVQAEATKLKLQGINIIIALGHAGFEKDQEIARQVPEVDVVVGGHTNTFLYTGTPPSDETPEGPYPFMVNKTPGGKQVPVVQAFTVGKYLGVLHLTFNDQGEVTEAEGNPVLLNASVAMNQALAAEVEEWAVPVREYGEHQVGQSSVTLNGEREECRYRECNMGNLITDAMVAMTMKPPDQGEWKNASAAIWNGGGIRASIAKGIVTRNDVITVLPFRNTVTLFELRGSDLRDVFEHAVRDYGTDYISGRFLQVSGIKVKYNLKKAPGSRVESISILCTQCETPTYKPLDDSQDYSILTSNFIRSGGDKYEMIRDKAKNEVEIGLVCADVVADYITKYSPITHGIEGRILLDECSMSACRADHITAGLLIYIFCLITVL